MSGSKKKPVKSSLKKPGSKFYVNPPKKTVEIHNLLRTDSGTYDDLHPEDYSDKRKKGCYIFDKNGKPVSSYGYTGDKEKISIIDRQTRTEGVDARYEHENEKYDGIYIQDDHGKLIKVFEWVKLDEKNRWDKNYVLREVGNNNNIDDETVLNTIANMKIENVAFIKNIDEENPELTRVCSNNGHQECTKLVDYIQNLWRQLFGQQSLIKSPETLGGKKSKSRKLKTAKKQKKRKTIRRRK